MHAKASIAIEWTDREKAAWAPPEKMTIAEWAERKRVLVEPAEEKGPLRLSRTPYLVPIMNAFQDRTVEEVVFCKPAQIAGTEAMISTIGYYSDQEPCPIMCVLADEDTAVYMNRERLQKMYEHSPALKHLHKTGTFGKWENTLPNGTYIAIGWASSVAKLASRPIRIVILDEVDKPGYLVATREANPISLAIERTETFYNKKIGILSTPTNEDGNIWRRLHSCDVIYDWHVPCPYCGIMQPLRWSVEYASGCEDGKYFGEDGDLHPVGHVVWDGWIDATFEQIQDARYSCGNCGELWNTQQKNEAVKKGKMVPRSKIVRPPRRVGFHINRIYSLLGKSGDLSKLVDDFIKCKKSADPSDMQGFINSTLAETYKKVVVEIKNEQLVLAKTQLAPQVVPKEAIALTCAVDVQKNGRWFVVRAWAADTTSWLIHYGLVSGWPEIESIIFDSFYPVEDSDQRMGIWRAAVDIGGGDRDDGITMTEDTEIWLHSNKYRGVKIWATKGSSSAMGVKCKVGANIEKTPAGKPLPGGVQLVMLNTDMLKEAFHHRLTLAAAGEPQGSYLHSETDSTYFSHITAEEKQRDPKTGKEEWVKIRARNDLLDCEVMSLALVDHSWPVGGLNLIAAMRDVNDTFNHQNAIPKPKPKRAPRW